MTNSDYFLETDSEQPDSGITLVELLVYIMLFGVVSALLASFVIRTVQTQAKITDIQQSNATNQSLHASLDIAIRNSSPDPEGTNVIAGNAAGDELLYVSNLQRATLNAADGSLSEVNWICTYWYYDKALRTIYRYQGDSAIASSYDPHTWSPVASRVLEPSSSVFDVDSRSWDVVPTSTPSPMPTDSVASIPPPIRIAVDIQTETNGTNPDIRISSIYSGIGVDASSAIPCRPGSGTP